MTSAMTLDEFKFHMLESLLEAEGILGGHHAIPAVRAAIVALPDRSMVDSLPSEQREMILLQLAKLNLLGPNRPVDYPNRMPEDFSGPGRLFCVRIRFPGTKRMQMVIAIRVSDADVDRVADLAARDGLDREATFIACAIDGARIGLERSGMTRETLSSMTGAAVEVSMDEMARIAAAIRSKQA